MGKRSKRGAGAAAGAVKAESREGPFAWRLWRRWTSVFLMTHARHSAAEAAEAVGFARAEDAQKWADRFDETGDVLDDGARRGPPRKITPEQGQSIAEGLKAQKSGAGVKRVMRRLTKEGVLSEEPCTETGRRAARRSGVAYQPTTRNEGAHPNAEARTAFARKMRHSALGKTGLFTDSKFFDGGDAYKQGLVKKAWWDADMPKPVDRTKAPYKARAAPPPCPHARLRAPLTARAPQVHAYAGVTYYGATDLYFVTGTTRLNLGYPRLAKLGKKEQAERDKVVEEKELDETHLTEAF